MNIIWSFLIISGIFSFIFISPDLVITSMLNGCENALTLSLELCGIYALWLGLLKIVEESEISFKLEKIFSPILNKIFKNESHETKTYLSINIVSNLLGLGNASIPSGINAINSMYKQENFLTTSMLLLVILNTCNLQIFPTTIISLRTIYGSLNPTAIIIPNILASIFSLGISCLFVYIFTLWRKRT